MTSPGDQHKPALVSQRLFERFLAAYPRQHRAEYGPAMAQLFRDQCRDAWRDARGRGLLLLWLRILPDLLKTSLLEHLANLKGKKFMPNKISTGVRSPSSVRSAFLIVFVLVFGFGLLTSTIITFILPEVYSSKARVKVERAVAELPAANQSQPSAVAGQYDPYLIQTEFEVIWSEVILDKVVDQLALNEAWGKKYNTESKLKTSESRALLKRMLEVRPIRNTSLLEITAYSDDKSEAANIANAVAENYRSYRQNAGRSLATEAIHEVMQERAAQGKKITAGNEEASVGEIFAEVNRRSAVDLLTVEIIDHAEPGFRPVRPNKPLNIAIGGFAAGCIGVVLGSIAAFVVSRLQRRWRKTPPPIQAIQSQF